MGGNLKVWVFKFRGKIFGGNTTVYISSGETNTVYLPANRCSIYPHLPTMARKVASKLNLGQTSALVTSIRGEIAIETSDNFRVENGNEISQTNF